MNVSTTPPLHLTYCTNIHPGETWEQVFDNVATHVVGVKALVSPDRPFGVGLRLSAQAARRLAQAPVLEAFTDFLRSRHLYVFTINGFPYGAFHRTAVKERVYRPDWLEAERVVYSDELAAILAALLPPGMEGSVSTVPGCFRERGALAQLGPRFAAHLRQHAAALVRLRESTGRSVTLALEPEPHCVLETTADAVSFFEEHLVSAESVAAFASLVGVARPAAEEALRRHLGVCLDACHAAVEFEEPRQAVDRLLGAGIRILKIQVSAGLRVAPPDAAARAALGQFAEGVYLHQVVARRGPETRRYLDLPQALTDAQTGGADADDEWRIHFHVPLHREWLGPFRSTQRFLAELLALAARRPITSHLEVETYTWDVLPEEYRNEPIASAVARELAWAVEKLRESVA